MDEQPVMSTFSFPSPPHSSTSSPAESPISEQKSFLAQRSEVSSGYDSSDNIIERRESVLKDADTETGSVKGKPAEKKRDQWSSKMDFILTIVGFTVDLANIWRFPYLAYQNGGGAFMIPYLTCLILAVFPLFYMELCLGQFHRLGSISVWRIAPIFKGLGYAIVVIIFWVGMYYTVVMAWGFYYLFHSFTYDLPWTSCNHTYNTENCWDGNPNVTFPENVTRTTAATEFFERYVLGSDESDGLHQLGGLSWRLALTNLMVFLILYFVLWKGIKASGKVVWVTATLPFIILGVLLIRGLMLPGAMDGVKFFIFPRLDRITDPSVWVQAAIQVFFSAGVGLGTHIAYGSYNEFNNNCLRDCIITTVCNSLSSIFSGFVIFSYLGYMALRQGVEIPDVATQGPGLVFCVYPEAISTLPGAPVWSVAFFTMLIMLGMDSSMGCYESVVTAVVDEHDFFKRRRFGREIFLALFMTAGYLASLASLTKGGYYLVALLDAYACGLTMLTVALCELIAVAWFYGLDNFDEDVKAMLGHSPSLAWRICWKFVSPTFIVGVLAAMIMWSRNLSLETHRGVYIFPPWANALGWLIACSSLIMIPLVALITYRRQQATQSERKLALAISPVWEHQAIKSGDVIRRYDCRHWFSLGGRLSCLKPEERYGIEDKDIVYEYQTCSFKELTDAEVEATTSQQAMEMTVV